MTQDDASIWNPCGRWLLKLVLDPLPVVVDASNLLTQTLKDPSIDGTPTPLNQSRRY
ncbi:hypothetical protein M419DRAFT_119144 [Trichoderma reesei RUT C-30]|uniref:Uncharacterized protein n=1 Tax=Hypocrea jecorina (strain ATCC 56765 / BCRC 32924 / NRRL 11460 / Rut C-30) TaxID=1344414 RepID=A0A024SAY4_HYPJR|nr:hypothetical protein M419DRAFT_119144 [Trichoderma reesei RUT C-30]